MQDSQQQKFLEFLTAAIIGQVPMMLELETETQRNECIMWCEWPRTFSFHHTLNHQSCDTKFEITHQPSQFCNCCQLCNSPRMGWAWRITPIYTWRKQAIMEWSRQVISIVASRHSVKLCALAPQAFRSQQNGAVTSMQKVMPGATSTKRTCDWCGSAIFVKPQQWPTPSESIAIYCVRKLVSCITHLQSCAKVDIWNKKKK